MATSELALRIAKANKETTETVGAMRLAQQVDEALAPVRECLELLQRLRLEAG